MNISLETSLSDFRRCLFRKPAEVIEQKGSCYRLKIKTREIAELVLELTNQQKLPVNLDAVCKVMNVHTIQVTEGSPFESELKPDKKGFTIKINRNVIGVRRRAAIAHEVGHTLFYDSSEMPPRLILKNFQLHSKIDKQEWLSWDFARELLLPKRLVEEHVVANRCLSLENILSISKKSDVSVDLLVHRFFYDLDAWQNCAVVIFDMFDNSVGKVRQYRGKRFPKFRVLGQMGLTRSRDFQALITEIERTPNLERGIEFQGFQLWVSMIKYGNAHSRVLGFLEIPALSGT